MGKITPYIKLVKYLGDQCKPVSIQFNLTNRCGCHCLMCKKYDWKLGELDFDSVVGLIRQFEENKAESIVFSGGDPLVYPGFADVMKETNTAFGILTAGNVLFRSWDIAVERAKWIRFSIDAADVEKWKLIRGSTDSGYGHLIKNLEEVSRLKGKAAVRINFCRIKGINEDQEEKVKELAQHLGFDFMAHEVRVFKQYMNKEEHHDENVGLCIIPYLHAVVEADGSVFPCCDVMNENAELENVNFKYSLGNLKNFNFDFYKLWFSDKAQEIKNFFYKNRVKECATCPMRYYPCNIEYEKQHEGIIFL